jgi:hypothetical protein
MSRKRPPGPINQKQQLKAILAHAKGVARNSYGLLRTNVITLPKINGPTLEEIEAKYGPIGRTTHEQN